MAASGFPSLIRGTSVVVSICTVKSDPFEGSVYEYEDETVDNVLFQVGGTDDLSADRPNGTRVDATFHFTKEYVEDLERRGKSLYRAKVKYRGTTYEVEGDPTPLMEGNTPGPWCLAAPVRNVRG